MFSSNAKNVLVFFLESFYMLLNYSSDVLGHIFKRSQFIFLQHMKRTDEETPYFNITLKLLVFLFLYFIQWPNNVLFPLWKIVAHGLKKHV